MSPRLDGAMPTSGIGSSQPVRLEVDDPRADPLRVGETDDLYHHRIELDRSPQDLLLEAFALALPSHGYVLSDDATTTFRVGVLDVAATWATEFGASAQCSVSFSVELQAGGETLGSKGFVKRAEEAVAATSDGTREGSRCLSFALEQAVQRAAGNPELASLVHQATRMSAAADASPAPVSAAPAPQMVSFAEMRWRLHSGPEVARLPIPTPHRGRVTDTELVADLLIVEEDARIPGIDDDLSLGTVSITPLGSLGDGFRITNALASPQQLETHGAVRVSLEDHGAYVLGSGTLVVPVGSRIEVRDVVWAGVPVERGRVQVLPTGLELVAGPAASP